MNVERTDVEARAARHAALSDPTRLRVVDLLVAGDRSPGELQVELGVPSNLLAHHLNLLEQEGIIARSRSEADGRRSYVHLVPGGLDGLGADAHLSARRVVFVCRANSARSQLAQALWSEVSDIPAASAGTHPADWIDPGAVRVAERHGLTLRGDRPVALADVLSDEDYVITVCDSAHEELAPAAGLHWSVPDPVRLGTSAAFDNTYQDIARRIHELAPRMTAA